MPNGLGFVRMLRDFALWCTISCLQKIATSPKWLRVIFTGVFFTMIALFVFVSTNCTRKYFQFPSSTELSIDVKSPSFPRISVCNENPMKRSVVKSNSVYAEIEKLMRQYELIEQSKPTADDFQLTKGTKSRLQRGRRARMMLRLQMAKLSDADRIAAGYAFTELVSECTFGGKTCTSGDFSSFLHPDYGVCWTFNGERTIAKAGKAEGLRMLMTVNQDLNGKFDYLPTTDSVTAWAVIYDHGDYPDFTKGAFKVGAGSQSLVALSKSTRDRLEKPYGTCTNDTSSIAEHYGNYTYTMQACQHACLQRMASERCGCADPIFPKAANETYCTTPENVRCLISLTIDVADAKSENGKTMCGCLSPCVETIYDKTFSNSIYPSDRYLVATGTQGQRGKLLAKQGGGRKGPGQDDWNDYENPSITTKTARSTTARPSTTTGKGTMPPTTTTAGTAHQTSTTIGVKTASSSTTTGTPTGTSTTTTTQQPTISTSTVASTSTTTPRKPCWYPGPPASGAAAIAASKDCLDHPLFSDPNIIAIRGYPCTSIKHCNTCIFFKPPAPSVDAFPCSYDFPMACSWKSDQGYFHQTKCYEFFTNYSFIPIGTEVPNVPGWFNGAVPGQFGATTCTSNRASSDLSKLKNTPEVPLDHNFLEKLKSSTTVCAMVDLAIADAEEHYAKPAQNSGSGKRKKRATTTDTVDLPGVGSCEFANKNFKGAADCIAWYKRNGLMMHIYFETLEVQSFTQGATYPLVALLSDISGHASFWLGMSVVSVVELIGLLIMCFSYFFCNNRINVLDEDEIRREVDNRERGRARAEDYPRIDPDETE